MVPSTATYAMMKMMLGLRLSMVTCRGRETGVRLMLGRSGGRSWRFCSLVQDESRWYSARSIRAPSSAKGSRVDTSRIAERRYRGPLVELAPFDGS